MFGLILKFFINLKICKILSWNEKEGKNFERILRIDYGVFKVSEDL